MNREPIDITGLDKYKLMAALCNNTKPLGMGRMNPKAGQEITPDDIYELFEEYPDREAISFDYVFGRPIKISLVARDRKLLLDHWWLYDRDAGEGEALRIVQELKDAGKPQA